MLFRLLSVSLTVFSIVSAEDWPSYRGRAASGLGAGKAPTRWNGEAQPPHNIKWKARIPGLSHSSPVVIGNKLFVTSAVSSIENVPLKLGLYGSGDSAEDNAEQEWVLYCLDKRTGKVLWQQTAHRGKPLARRHTKATHANTTVASDGKRVVVFFGSEGLYSYTLDGKLEWKRHLGTLDMAPSDDRSLSWGFASSPVLFEDAVIVQADSKKDGFLASFAAADGRELWRVPRSSVSVCSWATPGVFRTGSRTQIVANGYPFIAGYDFKTGSELWRLKSEGDIPVPTPFMARGLIYVANAHGGKAPLYAIRPDALGDITPEAGSRSSSGVVWSEERNGSYLQTPVVYGDEVYASTSQGIFKAYDARTGRRLYEQRLGSGGSFTSSPIVADGKIYISNEEGQTYVIKAGPKFEVLSTNSLGEPVLATPAVSDGCLFVRTPRHVVAVGE
jgi:outer membrane protein assembly factor BamB